MKFHRFSGSSAFVAVVVSLSAQAALARGEMDDAAEDQHHNENAEIVVTGTLRAERKDALSGIAVLRKEELASAVRPSIGESLEHTPGVSASSFGPTASRPVLRGLQGERVRVLSNGIGSIDVSNTSADHAPAVNPVLAQRIEVLRGPQSLQYGSAAIGGVVNVIDKRIPETVPDEPIHVDALGSFGSAATERAGSVSVEVPLGRGWVGHADASYLKTDDIKIGGYALSPALRAQALASSLLPPDPLADPDIDFAANAALRGRLPNTASRSWSAGAGLAYVNDFGNIGVAYSHLDNFYGVPVRFATEPGQEQEAPRLKMRQDRLDARAQLRIDGGFLSDVNFRYAFGDYYHAEIDPDGIVGTVFLNQGAEGRLDFVQTDRGGWKGVSGVQLMSRDFDAIGDEAFLPRNSTAQFGLFSLQQLARGPLLIEAGGRYERTRTQALPLPSQPQFFEGERVFGAWSFALGAAYDFARDWKIGVNLSRVERAPAAEELFAFGPHAGTESYEIGDPNLVKEHAWSVEGILRAGGDGFALEASAFYSWFGNFVYQARTGAMIDGLPVYQTRQADARLWGAEVQANLTLFHAGPWTFSGEGLLDFVKSTIAGVGPAPRIPPLRMLGGIKAKSPDFDLGIEVEHVTAQNSISAFETPTPAYTLANAELVWRPNATDRPLSVILSANNLFNVVARRHASLLKDYAPLGGRDIRLTVRLEI